MGYVGSVISPVDFKCKTYPYIFLNVSPTTDICNQVLGPILEPSDIGSFYISNIVYQLHVTKYVYCKRYVVRKIVSDVLINLNTTITGATLNSIGSVSSSNLSIL